jgi:hypothetical protein
MSSKNEFSNYTGLHLEERILSPEEVSTSDLSNLISRAKRLIKKSSAKLKDQQISIAERASLIKIATSGLQALNSFVNVKNTTKNPNAKDDSVKKALLRFFLTIYPNALADASFRELAGVSYFDQAIDPRSEIGLQKSAIETGIQASPFFSYDVPRREFGMSGLGAIDAVASESFFTKHKEHIIISLGALALGGLAYHVFYNAKKV